MYCMHASSSTEAVVEESLRVLRPVATVCAGALLVTGEPVGTLVGGGWLTLQGLL